MIEITCARRGRGRLDVGAAFVRSCTVLITSTAAPAIASGFWHAMALPSATRVGATTRRSFTLSASIAFVALAVASLIRRRSLCRLARTRPTVVVVKLLE